MEADERATTTTTTNTTTTADGNDDGNDVDRAARADSSTRLVVVERDGTAAACRSFAPDLRPLNVVVEVRGSTRFESRSICQDASDNLSGGEDE